MASCLCKPFIPQNVDIQSDLYKSSYNISYFYVNSVDHSFINVRNNRAIKADLDVPDPGALKMLESVSKKTFVPKYWEHCNSMDFSRRSSSVSKPTLKNLHEKCLAYPPRPLKWGTTTTGSTYVQPKKLPMPKPWPHASPIEESTCAISSSSTEGLPPFLPNESGYMKCLDPYVSTSQLAHCNFNENQHNGLARKNILTFWDTIGLPKSRGFGPKKSEPFGSYYHRDKVAPCRVQAKSETRVPFSGIASTYEDSYNCVKTTNLMHQGETIYPAIYKPIDTPSYCTEQCHIGTGWPVRGSVDIGTVRGTY